MNTFLEIIWAAKPEVFKIGEFEIRWYGILFATAFLVGQKIVSDIFKKEGKSEKELEAMILYMIIATILGARLGHCLFYEPSYYLSNPIKILMIWEGGLASHGAAAGILFAIYLYSKKFNTGYIWTLDRLVIVIALGGAFIRFGNFMNSEIIGKPADVPTSVVFMYNTEKPIKKMVEDLGNNLIEGIETENTGKEKDINGISHPLLHLKVSLNGSKIDDKLAERIAKERIIPYMASESGVDKNVAEVIPTGISIEKQKGNTIVTIPFYGIPRHPAQLYESFSSFLIFLLLFLIYRKYETELPTGRIFGIFLILLFSLRFVYEFLKENQVGFEEEMALNMGQILSIPLVLAGFFVLWRSFQGKEVED